MEPTTESKLGVMVLARAVTVAKATAPMISEDTVFKFFMDQPLAAVVPCFQTGKNSKSMRHWKLLITRLLRCNIRVSRTDFMGGW